MKPRIDAGDSMVPIVEIVENVGNEDILFFVYFITSCTVVAVLVMIARKFTKMRNEGPR